MNPITGAFAVIPMLFGVTALLYPMFVHSGKNVIKEYGILAMLVPMFVIVLKTIEHSLFMDMFQITLVVKIFKFLNTFDALLCIGLIIYALSLYK